MELSDTLALPQVRQMSQRLPEPKDVGSEAERAAIEFEAVFLAEMLRHTGLGKAREAFGGGAGEEVFSSLMTREWARSLAENGGIGLADRLLQDLQRSGGIDAQRQ